MLTLDRARVHTLISGLILADMIGQVSPARPSGSSDAAPIIAADQHWPTIWWTLAQKLGQRQPIGAKEDLPMSLMGATQLSFLAAVLGMTPLLFTPDCEGRLGTLSTEIQESLAVLKRLLEQCRRRAPLQEPLPQWLQPALDFYHRAQGQFAPAMALLCKQQASPLLFPLVGFLSATHGLEGLPLAWRSQSFRNSRIGPTRLQRWPIANEAELEELASALWSLWTGQSKELADNHPLEPVFHPVVNPLPLHQTEEH